MVGSTVAHFTWTFLYKVGDKADGLLIVFYIVKHEMT